MKTARMVLTDVGTTKLGQRKTGVDDDDIGLVSDYQEWLTRTRPNHFTGDKIRPVNMENTSEAPNIQCHYNLLRFIRDKKIFYLLKI